MASPTERVFGRGIVRGDAGDWVTLAGGRIKTDTGLLIFRTRLWNRALSANDGWYHLPGEGLGLREYTGMPLNDQVRGEILNRLELFRRDPAVVNVRAKKVTQQTAFDGTPYKLIECIVDTRDGEIRFTDRDGFEIGG